MGHFSVEIYAPPGSTLSRNQHERTFFRQFPDKREALFDGEGELAKVLVAAIQQAPSALGIWDVLLAAFQATVPFLVENQPFAERRRRIIASSTALQERELAKTLSLTRQLAGALRARGTSAPVASLAAQLGMAAYGHAFAQWLDEGADDLGEEVARAFKEVSGITSGSDEIAWRLLQS